MNTNKDKKCIHDGHRKRLRQSIETIGLEKMNAINQLEFILTLCKPRGDTNELAHRLLDEFGSITNVLDAPKSCLEKVKGVGKSTASILSIFPDIINLYIKQKAQNTKQIKTVSHLMQYARSLFIDKQTEHIYVIFVKKDMNTVVGHMLLGKGDYTQCSIDILELTKELLKRNAAGVIFVHNHPEGTAKPSNTDISSTEKLCFLLKNFGVTMVDSAIVGKDDFYSIQTGQHLFYDY